MEAILILLFFGFMIYRSAKIIDFLLGSSDVTEDNSKIKIARNFSADCLLFFFAWVLAFINSMLFPVSIYEGCQKGMHLLMGSVSVLLIPFQLFLNLMPVDYFRLYIKLLFWVIGILILSSILSVFLTDTSIVIELFLLAFFLYVSHRVYKKINISLDNSAEEDK